ncbi:putative thiazole-containing bacteriocin maturation protein [Paenibacillus radicis (ex Xue et al. 2023)]|uniref:Thiazole-containing bacteriocin maturation protein n=1 Tax=Paenibacillus radicis (ex Xue et al. 2023) TaxID=2972489 RepID=A0ABT1YA94_9BACL|nr:putative thiazole-containing bacteriocin maturation protein [Paenibacillus radicis (ex Xue et al. 2023)]MCR8630126.1 putative thiazole-containing bacteriocin maturation protein [Paenibacillus radicis (ex Xue et al. 2023)]
MPNLTPAARLKVKADTFFLPVPNEGVYFRNNLGTFRMEGEMIDRWIEKLIPMFNGEYTLEDLTDGLSSSHRDRVYEIADVLHQKGFIRDVSQDRSHQLTNGIIQKHAAQIAFLDSFGDSGAYRFQCYRQASVLAIGSGPFFVALVSALIESGLPRFHMLITESVPTNRQRLMELAEHARRTDPEVLLEEITLGIEGADGWRDVVQPFQSILYVSQEGDVEELRHLHSICKTENKIFVPAMFLHQTGMAGPVVHPASEGCWESAWRRLHESAVYKDPALHVFSSTAGAMLANVIVFELFKTVTGESELRNSFFLLDLETLEGSWHPFMPHPMIHGFAAAQRVQISNLLLDRGSDKSATNRLLTYFNHLTSTQTGILHIWEEGALRQLPLSQCRVQAVEPLSEGPAKLQPELVCAGLTHEEARREAGLTGIEAYVSRLISMVVNTKEIVGIGVGETAAEGVIRGLQANLTEQLARQQKDRKHPVIRTQLSKVEDERCRFYLQALTAMRGAPVIGIGEEVFGFPTIWVGTGDFLYGSTGLNSTMALQNALKAALHRVQNNSAVCAAQVLQSSSVNFGKELAVDLVVPSSEEAAQPKVLQEALQILRKNGKELYVVDLAVEPFLKEGPEGVFGVLLREEESR